MKSTSKSVKIKGKPSIPFTYDRPETWEECQDAFSKAQGTGQVSDKLSIVEVFCYGFELKIRAKIQAANTDEGSKTRNRQLTMGWVMGKPEGEEFRAEVLELLKGDSKVLNKYLDDLYAEEEASITGA